MTAPPEVPETLAAGPFGQWLAQFRAALRGDRGMDVPCGGCVGCCVSGYSIQVRATDRRALARIPVELLVEAPGFPSADRVMPARPDGTCRMLGTPDDPAERAVRSRGCSIYADRPQTCLDYDCRIFAAAGLEAGAGKDVINERVRAWRFTYPSDEDRRAHEAVRAAAAFIEHKGASFPVRVPRTPTGIAVMAVKAYEVFLATHADTQPEAQTAAAVVEKTRQFDTAPLATPAR